MLLTCKVDVTKNLGPRKSPLRCRPFSDAMFIENSAKGLSIYESNGLTICAILNASNGGTALPT